MVPGMRQGRCSFKHMVTFLFSQSIKIFWCMDRILRNVFIKLVIVPESLKVFLSCPDVYLQPSKCIWFLKLPRNSVKI